MIPAIYEVCVESSVPGRIRLRVPRDLRLHESMSKIAAKLKETNGIHKVQVSPTTGSILIQNDPKIIDADTLLKAINVKPAAPADTLDFITLQPWPGKSKTGLQIVDSFRKFDQGVSWATKGNIDGKMTVVLTLLALSMGRAFLSEKRVLTPWYTLLWYSYSMFMHWYNPTKDKQLL